MEKAPLGKFCADTAKGAAPYFMTGNALVNWETHSLIAAFYAAALVVQTAVRRVTSGGAKASLPVTRFVLDRQGCLATNAAMTLGAGATTFALGGSALLGGAALAFGAANMGQALIYGGKLLPKKPVARNFALAACEVGMIGGFMAIGMHVGLGVGALVTIAGVGGAMAAARSFKPAAIHPDLAYVDMLITAGMTFAQAIAAQNYTVAASRLFAMVGVSRLAVQRADNDNKTSFFAIERNVPRLWTYLRAKSSQQAHP